MTHALYSVPEFTVTLGNVATYSIIPVLELGFGVVLKEERLDETGLNASVSRNLTLDDSPLFTETSAITSPLVFSTPKIVRIILNISVPRPVSAYAKLTKIFCEVTIIIIIAITVTTIKGIVTILLVYQAEISIELPYTLQVLTVSKMFAFTLWEVYELIYIAYTGPSGSIQSDPGTWQ